MRFSLILTIGIAFGMLVIGCVDNQIEPELEILFTELKDRADPHDLDNFKNTPREVAVVNQEIFSNTIRYPFEIFFDSIYKSTYKEFWIGLERRPFADLSKIMFVAAYHKWLNNEKLDFYKIENDAIHYQQLINRKRDLEFYRELFSKSYFRFFIPADDSISMAVHQEVYSREDLNQEEKEYYYLKTLDSIIIEGMEDGKYNYEDWAEYYNRNELEHLLEIMGKDDFPY